MNVEGERKKFRKSEEKNRRKRRGIFISKGGKDDQR